MLNNFLVTFDCGAKEVKVYVGKCYTKEFAVMKAKSKLIDLGFPWEDVSEIKYAEEDDKVDATIII